MHYFFIIDFSALGLILIIDVSFLMIRIQKQCSCFSNEGNGASEEEERALPGVIIAGNADHVRFLYTLADIGYAYGNKYLRGCATNVLK